MNYPCRKWEQFLKSTNRECLSAWYCSKVVGLPVKDFTKFNILIFLGKAIVYSRKNLYSQQFEDITEVHKQMASFNLTVMNEGITSTDS